MGIQGLLSALKSIQTTKHLSEFSGQTIAVDAYVWLHKGVFTCATELATGKPTTKYVTYAMEKVRLLRYHGIEPYIVFDGGPLPAKRHTEVERKRRRDEQRAKGNLLASQGQHSQARDCYLKCVDVTPQMAFQLIKALRAESVQYVVAPYEADAQLAFLERQGIVSAILTEDSDLLVFGCKTVLLKFDSVARTVISISRADFASVTSNSSDSNGISLVGWSDTQFRAMAILSGCDYLPSIPGIGLKTACALLRKWKTPEAVVRHVALEGKKSVPKGYLNQFKLADNCFLHQRVYDPSTERLVYLTDVDPRGCVDLTEAYIGGDLERTLAKRLALGDIDPVTLEPMVDINPGYNPSSRVLRNLDNGVSPSRKSQGKSKSGSKSRNESILNFFGPNPIIPPRPKSPTSKPKVYAGRASGKRTLAEVMDQDVAAKKKKRRTPLSAPASPTTSSRFFVNPVVSDIRRTSSGMTIQSRTDAGLETENLASSEDEVESVHDGDSLVAHGYPDTELEDHSSSNVEQEDGYISPSASMSRVEDEFSSPSNRPFADDADDNFGADPVSSPVAVASVFRPRRLSRSPSLVRAGSLDKILVHDSPVPLPNKLSTTKPVVDLKECLDHDASSDIDYSGSDNEDSTPPYPSPLTPVQTDTNRVDQSEEIEDDPAEEGLRANALRTQAVAAGWRNRWAHEPSYPKNVQSSLKRRETNITPTGRHRQLRINEDITSAPRVTPRLAVNPIRGRKSLSFLEETSVKSTGRGNINVKTLDSDVENVSHSTEVRNRLERFCYS
ncbi:exodeoxyribonuclease 1 [Lentinula raphanica]|nr:exodeoxyribonuclease 1 [Lentinula raphanica]